MFWNFATSLFASIKLILAAGVLAAALMLSGCTSSSTSNTASYGGPSVSSVSAKRSAARRSVMDSKKSLRASRNAYNALNRTLKRDQRLIKRKRVSKKAKANLKRRIKVNKRKLRQSKRNLAKAERKFNRARRNEKKAIDNVAKAKRRKIDAERRMAVEKRRLAKEKKLREHALAQKESGLETTVTSATSGLFSPSDPALKNVRDYGARIDSSFPVAAIPVEKLNKRLYRQEVSYRSSHKPGTLVVDTGAKFLYLVKPGGRAMRYGIGVGKAGFEWSGAAHIGWKQQWPKWTPPDEMIERRPDLAKWSSDNGGMPGGPTNPLGARALYLMQGNVDTLFRLHGTPEWSSIGTAASSGCIRLMNQDIIDLYNRVPNGTKVVVL